MRRIIVKRNKDHLFLMFFNYKEIVLGNSKDATNKNQRKYTFSDLFIDCYSLFGNERDTLASVGV
ncbi:hypothetical protein [Chryseobacterium paridis]|uniref:Uncharacterized protein n=1 Tax=Chryseobacterium paridis TaxID=2800328 RepID=A0ABS1G183_9FLAO|nr:hypothetical protein [Chryseobacterium paridis]MBK1898278.1 hypothetical protein [Chryseobacterium paridis]